MKIGRRSGAVLVLAVAPAAFFGGQAIAGGSPANKMVAAGGTTQVVGANQTVTLLTGKIKTSKPKDLILQTSLECSIFTDLTTNNTTPSSSALGRVVAWLELDGKIVPIQQVSAPPQDGTIPEAGTEADKVPFCDRAYSRSVTDDENPLDGIDEEADYIRTKSSHGFNWVKMNVGSGDHTVVLKARFTTETSGNAAAEAIVGNRTLIVEPTKMSNDAVISDIGTN